MKRITVVGWSVSLSVVLGLGAAGAVFYAHDASALRGDQHAAVLMPSVVDQEAKNVDPTPEMIAAWKATALASDYIRPQAPI